MPFANAAEIETASPAAIKARAKEIFSATYHYPEVPFRSIGRSCFAWALNAARFEAVNGTDAERREREAEEIAAACGFNVGALDFQVSRRRFGSFTTTVDGSPARLRIYERALAIATSRTLKAAAKRARRQPILQAAE